MLTDRDALLIVDVQHDFLPGGALAVPDGDAVVPVLAACVQIFEEQTLPIFASRDWHPPDHCSFEASGGIWPPHCVAGTGGAELEAALQLPADATIVDKGTTTERDAYSAFDGTELQSWLRERGVTRLFIGGLATEYCVLKSAEDALQNGIEVMLMENAIRAIDASAGRSAIEDLRRMGAIIIQSGDIPDA